MEGPEVDETEYVEMSHVYVVEAAGGHCKIGKADDVQARIRSLQTARHDILALRLALPVPRQFAAIVERQAHAVVGGT